MGGGEAEWEGASECCKRLLRIMFVIEVNTTFKPRCDVEHASSSAALYLRTLMNSIAAAAQHNHFGLRHIHFSAREHSSVTTCLSAAATDAMHHDRGCICCCGHRRLHPPRRRCCCATAACCVELSCCESDTKASYENDTGIYGRKLVRVHRQQQLNLKAQAARRVNRKKQAKRRCCVVCDDGSRR